jgi:hypothetical protein
MARRSHYALSAAVAGACLTLSACGAGSAPAAAGSPSVSTQASGPASQFCGDATSFMRHIPAAPSGKHTSPAKARANLHKVLRDTIKGFTSLEAEAPARLHAPLKKIIRIYKSDEKALRSSASMAQISQAMVRGNASGSVAFQKVLKYIGTSCH